MHKSLFIKNIVLALLCIVAFFVIDVFSVDSILLALGISVFYVIAATILNSPSDSIYNPLYWFSLIYVGYPLGAIYYSLGNADKGKFLVFTSFGTEVYRYLELASLWVMLSYISFALGYILFYKQSDINLAISRNKLLFYKSIHSVSPFLIPSLLAIGGGYWIFLSYTLVGGPIELLTKFAAFTHLIKDYKGTTLPYHAYYMGIFLWLFVIVASGKRLGFTYYTFSFIGLLISISQGRIMNSITYLLAQVAFCSISNKKPAAIKRNVLIITTLFFAGFVALFLRVASSLSLQGKDSSYLFVDSMIDTLSIMSQMVIGWGNVADLQQIAIIFKVWTGNHLYGMTYFDWLTNIFGKYVGIEPTSIGLTIKEMFFPHQSGAPTPGAIGEAYANFGIFGLIFMFSVGCLLSKLFHYVKRSGSLLLIMCYSMFLMRFVLLYAKVDSTVLVNAVWLIFPFLLLVGFIHLLYRATRDTVR